MRAVINATGLNPLLTPFIHHWPSPLFRIVDKPILVHIIEQLQALGVQHFEIICHHLPQMVEECLGEGRRWGVAITYHLVREADKPFTAIAPAAAHWPESSILLGDAEILPRWKPQKLDSQWPEETSLYFHGSRGWIGWAAVSAQLLSQFGRDWSYESLPDKLLRYQKVPVSGVMFSVKTLMDWQTSNHRALALQTPKALFPTTARMIDPGIWVSRATVLHPTAVLKGPVFIGENCQIMEGARIGPDVVIENHCIVDKWSSIRRALICQHSYVGEGLEIYRSIVDQHTLLNLTLGASVNINDDFILAPVAPALFVNQLVHAVERALAFLLMILLAPLIVGSMLWYGLMRQPKVRLPGKEEPHHWRTFGLLQYRSHAPLWLNRWLTLLNIVKGDLHFVGLRPRSMEEFESLSVEQRRYLLEGKAGWLAVTEVESEADPEVVEPLYVSRQSVKQDLYLLYSWIKSKWHWGHSG